MTAGAMILGMIPMALGVGEGGEQNAPLARAVIGGLLFATSATLILVPSSTLCCGGAGSQRMGARPVHGPDEAQHESAARLIPRQPSTLSMRTRKYRTRVPENPTARVATPDEHGHVPVSTDYAPTTGKRLRIFVGLLAIVLSDRVLRCKSFQAQQEAVSARKPHCACSSRRRWKSSRCNGALVKADVGSAGRNERLVQLDDLCARNGLCGPVAGRHRGQRKEGSGHGDH